MKNIGTFSAGILAVIVFTTVHAATAAAGSATAIPYQGHISDATGNDLTNDLPIEVRLYDSAIAGIGADITNSHVLYAEMHDAVHVEGGVFHIEIGQGNPLDAKWTTLPADLLMTKENVYLELWIDGERLSPRQRMGSVPAVLAAGHVKYADALTQKPTITPAMMPAYDASKITKDQFQAAQVPPLSTTKFDPAKMLPVSAITNVDASRFDTSAAAPKLNSSFLPANLDASTLRGSALGMALMPSSVLQSSSITWGSGTLGHHQMITLPSDFTSDQCSIFTTLGSWSSSAQDGVTGIHVSRDGSNVLSCSYTNPDGKEFNCDVNYMYVCKK